jgi:hypothetical protein
LSQDTKIKSLAEVATALYQIIPGKTERVIIEPEV